MFFWVFLIFSLPTRLLLNEISGYYQG